MPLSPHDDLLKSTLAIRSQAMAFLQQFMPPAISEGLDYSTLSRDPDSYVDEQLRSHFIDVVYSCRWKGSREDVKVSFLLEHKSYLPKNIHLQLLRYLWNVYEKQQKKGGKLNPVIPVVIYHGRKPWHVRSFSDHFALPLPDMARYLPQFDYEFIDLGKVEDDEIVEIKGIVLRNTCFLLRYADRQEMYLQLVSKKFSNCSAPL